MAQVPSYSTRTSTPCSTFSSSFFSTRPHMTPSSMMKNSRKMNRSALSISPVCICRKSGVCAVAISESMESQRLANSRMDSPSSMAETAMKMQVAAVASLFDLQSLMINRLFIFLKPSLF